MSGEMSKQDCTQLARVIVQWLREPNDKVHQITRILQVMGKERTFALLQKTLEVEAAGGLFAKNDVRRTIGGVFFSLAKQECTPEELQILFPTPTWKQTHAKKKRAQVHETEEAQAQEAENQP